MLVLNPNNSTSVEIDTRIRDNLVNLGFTKRENKDGTTERHLARAIDIKKLCELREYDVKGSRNFIMHCYAYWEGIYIREPEQLEKVTVELNLNRSLGYNNRRTKEDDNYYRIRRKNERRKVKGKEERRNEKGLTKRE